VYMAIINLRKREHIPPHSVLCEFAWLLNLSWILWPKRSFDFMKLKIDMLFITGNIIF
jgi:hypothetical protein